MAGTKAKTEEKVKDTPILGDTCQNCKFSFREAPDVPHLHCRRFPPVVMAYEWGFPTVQETDWCGEYQI